MDLGKKKKLKGKKSKKKDVEWKDYPGTELSFIYGLTILNGQDFLNMQHFQI